MDQAWVDVGAVTDVPGDRPLLVEVDGAPVVLVNADDGLRGLGATCTHRGGPLEKGRLEVRDDQACLRCPWHASVFRLSDGAVLSGPATEPQPSYEVRTVGGRVEVRPRG